MSGGRVFTWKRFSRAALVILISLIFAGLAATVVTLPPSAAGLSAEIGANLASTGISNPVTATLLNFRSYDTLLEVAVLLLAVIACRSLRSDDVSPIHPGGDVLTVFGRIQIPILIMIAGYLLWSGAHAPGGAFQAGTVLAAAGVLLILAGRQFPLNREGLPMRLGLALGLAVFVAVGIAGILTEDTFLGYSKHSAPLIVLLLEVSVTVSIAFALVEMFLSVLQSSSARAMKDKEEP